MCLVVGKFGWYANMERLIKAQTLGDTSSLEFLRGSRILEVNPDHPIIKYLNAACKNSPDSTEAIYQSCIDLLYHTALIFSGFSPDSPAEVGNKTYEMMAIALGGRWGRLEDGETEAASEDNSTGYNSVDTAETEVVEPSEVSAEADPWSS